MGTRLRVVVEASSRAAATRASEQVIREVGRLERVLSTWDPGSEMAVVNAAPVGQPIVPGPELATLLARAQRYARISGTAFDERIGALVDAWDSRGLGVVPTPDALVRARQATGSSGISVDERTGVVVRHEPAAWIDTGGFGKGAALGAVARGLDSAGVERALVDLGGQIWAKASAQHPWSVFVAHPGRRSETVVQLEVHGVSVATSGTSERFVEIDGVRWGHILDPRSGRPAPAWGSVTVVSSDPLEADALATALYAMGPRAGLEWVELHAQVDALFLEMRSGEVCASWTQNMQRWFMRPPPSSKNDSRDPMDQCQRIR